MEENMCLMSFVKSVLKQMFIICIQGWCCILIFDKYTYPASF